MSLVNTIKIALFVLITVFKFSVSKAQLWNKPGAKWTLQWGDMFSRGVDEYSLHNDTVVNGILCKSLSLKRITQNLNPPSLDTLSGLSDIYFYEQDSVVYQKNLFNFGDGINHDFDTLYNFKAKIGEHWTIKQYRDENCDSLLTITVLDTGRRIIGGISLYYQIVSYNPPIYFQLTDSILVFLDTIYERFGSLNKCFKSLPFFCASGWLDISYYNLICYHDEEMNLGENCLNLTTIGINQSHKTANIINAFPNPVSTKLRITSSEKCLQLIDMFGKNLLYITILKTNAEIDLSNITPGIYFLRAESGFSRKIAIQ